MKVQIKKEFLGDAETQSVFGATGKAGEMMDVDDKFADKAKANPTIEVSGAAARIEAAKANTGNGNGDDVAPRPRGRPPGS